MRRNGGGITGLRSAKSRGVYGNNYFPNNDDEDDLDSKPITVLGPLAPIFLPRDRTDPEALQNRLRIYSLCLLLGSAFFWCWAVLNTIDLRKSGGVDLGIVSFFGSGWSSALLLKSSLGGKWYDKNQIFGCCGKRADADDDDLYLGGSSGGGRNAYGNNNNKHHSAPGRTLRIFVVVTQILVVCNYLLGLLFAMTAGKEVYVKFATYCTTFAILWLLVSLGGFVLVRVYREALASTFGEEALNDRQAGVSCLRKLLLVLVNRSASSTTTKYYEEDEDEDDEIDQELMSLVEGKGARYSTTTT